MPRTVAIVAPSSVPFQIGGAEKLWWGLQRALGDEAGIFAELIKLPSPEHSFEDLVRSYKTFSELDLSHFDTIISTKYPAWMVSHPKHFVYMQHTLRGLYDTYKIMRLPDKLENCPKSLQAMLAIVRKPAPERGDLPEVFSMCQWALAQKSLPSSLFAFPGPLIRELVHFFDRVALNTREIKAFFAISKTVSARPEYFPADADVKIINHPSDLSGFYNARGEYIFTASRINGIKRVGLLMDAMRHVTADVAFKIAGMGPDLEELKKRAANDRRIEFLGHVPDSELPGYYAKALFVPFVPFDEDYGLITIEAMASGKPVLTAYDSGGVCEFVEDGVTGFQVEPEPRAIGRAMQKLVENPELAAKMGEAARRKVAHISWKNVSSGLLYPKAGNMGAGISNRPKVVVLCHFSTDPKGYGGQRRLYHLCASVSRNYDVTLICLNSPECDMPEERQIMPAFREIRVPWPQEILDAAQLLEMDVGASVHDLALMERVANCEPLKKLAREELAGAACLILSHPFLYPAVETLNSRLPLIYDAHNVELDMKGIILEGKQPELLLKLARAEGALCRAADAILCCSEQDAARLAQVYETGVEKCHLVPNGWDSSEVMFSNREQRVALRKKLAYPDARIAVFMGSYHKPNVEAALHIMEMAKKLPSVQFMVIGNLALAPEIRQADCPANVHFVGQVSEDVKNVLLQAADLGLNPITSGAGINLKIIEYLGVGLETISTPFGMRGIKGEFGGAAHICAVEDFPEAIARALEHPVSSAALREANLSMASSYDWKAVMRPVCGIIESLAARGTPNPGNEHARI